MAVRIPSFFLEPVIFLCWDNGVRHEPFGTAFFVEVPDDDPTKPYYWRYVVTARHCIEEVPAQEIFVRIDTAEGANTSGGRNRDLPTRKDDWRRHDSADVAVLPCSPVGHTPIRLEVFIDGDCRFRPCKPMYGDTTIRALANSEEAQVQIGDDIFFTGLFIQSAGSKQNLPIARFGNISRMPVDEMIELDTMSRGKVKIRAYLAECRSWGGHSGSPAFWYYPLYSMGELPNVRPYGQVVTGKTAVIALLGLVRPF